MKIRSLQTLLILIMLSLVAVGCETTNKQSSAKNDLEPILASGVIEANQVNISSELPGRIKDIHVEEGSQISAGDLLISLEDDLLLAQKVQAEAQYEAALATQESARSILRSAEASLTSAEANLNAAEIQREQVLAQVYALEDGDRVADWFVIPPSDIEMPAWYFQQDEEILAARNLVDLSWIDYQEDLANYQKIAEELGGEELLEAEERLANAQAVFRIATALRDRQINFWSGQEVNEQIDKILDEAEEELEEAQGAFKQILDDPQHEEILEARAAISVSKEYYDLARDYWASLSSGNYSFEVLLAEAMVAQAESSLIQANEQVTQAEIGLDSAEASIKQAEAALDVITLQLTRTQLTSPLAGIVLTKVVESGEMIGAGFTMLTIGNLSSLTVTVYLPENRYGQVNLADIAELSIDSYPELSFEAEVIYISDQAEYTPRNVQTQEERQNTVYAVKLRVSNPDGILKPGMPADVVFNP